jgi:hypothetical protein
MLRPGRLTLLTFVLVSPLAWVQISRRNTGEDSLPASHTCFFSIEVPPYRTEASMRKGLLTAIHFGMVGILNT